MSPVSAYFGGHGLKVMQAMKKRYGGNKGKNVFYATASKRGQTASKATGFKRTRGK